MQFIDTHAHIYDLEGLLPLVLERAQKNYIKKIYMPNIDEETIARMMDIAAAYPSCLPMMGIHPCHIRKDFIKQLYLIEEWLGKSAFIAVGEIGIDLYHDTALFPEQQEAFRMQLVLAKHYHLPVSIHCRNAFKEVIELLEKEQDGRLRGVIHCFTGNFQEAEACIALGFSLGIGGIITMPKSGLAATISAIDLKHLVLETDSPYLTPVPYRGKPNEPSYLPYTASTLAAVKETTLGEVACITTQNAETIFEPTQ
ncbi:Putative Tat-linked quality control protein TatD [Cardinium endosymbiont of Sogatella furcifera]|uniref:TatD family hydrolase n=1 Tax=Cardinium endosymbiont of Sogatella furcifera TaxID=650378 RepID=UPI000E0CCCFF|nr:TatD family hydrolase [Cardinium endosymbiont of Sogatella furcifera]AXI24308.1 Putative Tat-linked quality control protein TatD [Cardinium endosymbiont of Sogatella furcifera]